MFVLDFWCKIKARGRVKQAFLWHNRLIIKTIVMNSNEWKRMEIDNRNKWK